MLKNFKIVHDENRMANVIRFSIETIRGMEFWKTSGYFFGRFSTKKTSFFNEGNSKSGFP